MVSLHNLLQKLLSSIRHLLRRCLRRHTKLFGCYANLSYLEFLIDFFATKQNVNEYIYSPLQAVATAIRERYSYAIFTTEDFQCGKTLIRKLISLGASIHYRDYAGRSILNQLMTSTNNPFDSMFLGEFWLDAFSQAGVDILQYMCVEIAISEANPFFYRYENGWVHHYTLETPFTGFWD